MALEIAGGIVGGLSVLGGLIWGQWVAVGAGVGLIVHVCWLSQWHGAAAEALDHLAAIRKALESRQ